MAAGGFMFEKVEISYDSTAYPTKREWGLAVHKARCQAFLKAAKRATANEGASNWESIETGLYNEFSESITVDALGTGQTLYIQDVHPLTLDSAGQYPAFVSYFRAPVADELGNRSEFMIITASSFNLYSSYKGTPSYGMFIDYRRCMPCPNGGTSSQDRVLSHSCLQAFAANGFYSYDHESPSMKAGELYICQHVECMPQYCTRYQYTSLSKSLVYNPGTASYSFGYAVKGNVIETFYKRSNYASGIWLISICGKIFTDDCVGSEWPYGAMASGRVNDLENDNQVPGGSPFLWADVNSMGTGGQPHATLTSAGAPFPSMTDAATSSGGADIKRSCLWPAFLPTLANTLSIPSEIMYSAILFTYIQNRNNTTSPFSGSGLDDTKTITKGFVNTEIARCVPACACRAAGSVYQSGKFIALFCETGIAGMLIGWDASNANFV